MEQTTLPSTPSKVPLDNTKTHNLTATVATSTEPLVGIPTPKSSQEGEVVMATQESSSETQNNSVLPDEVENETLVVLGVDEFEGEEEEDPFEVGEEDPFVSVNETIEVAEEGYLPVKRELRRQRSIQFLDNLIETSSSQESRKRKAESELIKEAKISKSNSDLCKRTKVTEEEEGKAETEPEEDMIEEVQEPKEQSEDVMEEIEKTPTPQPTQASASLCVLDFVQFELDESGKNSKFGQIAKIWVDENKEEKADALHRCHILLNLFHRPEEVAALKKHERHPHELFPSADRLLVSSPLPHNLSVTPSEKDPSPIPETSEFPKLESTIPPKKITVKKVPTIDDFIDFLSLPDHYYYKGDPSESSLAALAKNVVKTSGRKNRGRKK